MSTTTIDLHEWLDSLSEIALHYDPSQASALAVVRGMLAQTLMQEVSRSTFSA